MAEQMNYNNNNYDEHYWRGFYWTSSLDEKEPGSGKVFYFNLIEGLAERSNSRAFGLLIRSVCK